MSKDISQTLRDIEIDSKLLFQDYDGKEWFKVDPITYDDLLTEGTLSGCLEEGESIHLTEIGKRLLRSMNDSLDKYSVGLIKDTMGTLKKCSEEKFVGKFIQNLVERTSPLCKEIVDENLEDIISVINEVKIRTRTVLMLMGYYILDKLPVQPLEGSYSRINDNIQFTT